MLTVICGLLIGFAFACFGYLKNRSSLRLLNKSSTGCEPGTVVVVIAARNEEDVIENTIRTLLAKAPRKNRILVIDESTDSTSSILRDLSRQFPNLSVLRNLDAPGKPGALNLALDHVTEEIILFLDADARLDWVSVERYRRAFCNPEIQVVYTDFESYNRQRSLTVVFQDVFFSFAKTFVFSGLFFRPPFMTSGLFARRKIFDIVGKFDPKTLVDDFDLYLRMRSKKLEAKFVLGPKCQIQYAFAVKELFRQMCRWYTGVIRELFKQISHGRYWYIPVLTSIGTMLFFPYLLLALAYVLPSGFLLGMLLPVCLAALYSAALFAYLFHDVRSWREAFINATLGIPVVYVFFQIVISVSFIKAFRKRQTWYKATRERG